MPAKAKAGGADLKESLLDSDPVVVEPFTPSALAATPTPVAGGSTTYPAVDTAVALPEIPVVYLLDRCYSNWVDFKRALNECAMTWNFPAWMTTIVYQGKEWQEMASKGVDLAQYFPIKISFRFPCMATGPPPLGGQLQYD